MASWLQFCSCWSGSRPCCCKVAVVVECLCILLSGCVSCSPAVYPVVWLCILQSSRVSCCPAVYPVVQPCILLFGFLSCSPVFHPVVQPCILLSGCVSCCTCCILLNPAVPAVPAVPVVHVIPVLFQCSPVVLAVPVHKKSVLLFCPQLYFPLWATPRIPSESQCPSQSVPQKNRPIPLIHSDPGSSPSLAVA